MTKVLTEEIIKSNGHSNNGRSNKHFLPEGIVPTKGKLIDLNKIQDPEGYYDPVKSWSAMAIHYDLPHFGWTKFRFPEDDRQNKINSLREILSSPIRIFSNFNHKYESRIGFYKDCLVCLYISGVDSKCYVAGLSNDQVVKVGKELLDKFTGDFPPPETNKIKVNFTSRKDDGGVGNWERIIEAPIWNDIQINYPKIFNQVTKLVEAKSPPSHAKLIVWHGPPGVGKTTALRSLCREWKDWADVSFICDVDNFLSNSTTYLLNTLVNSSKYQLIILEDAGEFLTVESGNRMRQALSRLLNVTDGMLGQGQKVIFLITTNEPLGKLHPAVTRPGRCWSIVEFDKLDKDASNKWLEDQGSDQRVNGAKSIADLYAIKDGFVLESQEDKPIGFV